jgi:hypothetical protein
MNHRDAENAEKNVTADERRCTPPLHANLAMWHSGLKTLDCAGRSGSILNMEELNLLCTVQERKPIVIYGSSSNSKALDELKCGDNTQRAVGDPRARKTNGPDVRTAPKQFDVRIGDWKVFALNTPHHLPNARQGAATNVRTEIDKLGEGICGHCAKPFSGWGRAPARYILPRAGGSAERDAEKRRGGDGTD